MRVTIQQVHRKLGQWSLRLKADAPPGLLSSLTFYGHIAVVPGRINPVERADETLDLARYVGFLRDVDTSGQITLSGVGVNGWLGDEDSKGHAIESAVTVTGATFASAITALAPASVPIGTIHTGVSGTISNVFQYQSRRSAIDYVCDTMGGEWKVTNRGYLDAGPAASLFQLTPTCVIARRDLAGYDMQTKALSGELSSSRSVKDYTTRVVIVSQALGSGTADAATVPYKDLHGNTVQWTRIVDETDDTSTLNAAQRAQAVLNLFSGVRKGVRLAAEEFDIAGDFQPGDVVWVWDPTAGLADTAYEVPFRGTLLNPVPVRVLAVTWPVTDGYTVGFRDGDGNWLDLTPWIEPESSGRGEIEVADSMSAALTSKVGSVGTVIAGGGGGAGDTAVPDVPTFGAFVSTSYQPDDGLSRATMKVSWTQPLNTDGSTIVDGDHYEIRYRPTGTTDWQLQFVPFDQTTATVTNLPPSTGFDWQIRCVDYASPPNAGAWSATTAYSTADDTTAPPTPAPPSVASSLVAVQITHTLGLASGGTYNLPGDMDHLEVHLGASSGFTPDATSLAGKLQANGAMVSGGIAAVGTFPTASTSAVWVKVVAVDRTGNRSTASSAASATATLIDTAHISDLTASKITAGTLSAAYTLSGSIKTAASAQRVEIDINGVRLYNSAGTNTVDLNTSTGNATVTGLLRTALSGQRIVIDSTGNGTIFFYPSTGSDFAYINAPSQNSCGVNSGNGGGSNYVRMYVTPTLGELVYLTSAQAQAGGRWSVGSTGAFGSALAGQSISLSVASGGSVTLNTNAKLLAASGGNASVENGNGTYFSANGTSAYVQAASGGQALIWANAAAGAYVWAQSTSLQLEGMSTLTLYGNTIQIGDGGSGELVHSGAIYENFVTTFSANVGISTTPYARLYRVNSSSARLKVDVQDYAGLDVAALQPVSYVDRRQWEDNGQSAVGLRRGVGFIAEELKDVPGGDLLLTYDADTDMYALDYDRVGVALVPTVQDLLRRVAVLEGRPAPAARKPRAKGGRPKGALPGPRRVRRDGPPPPSPPAEEL